MESLITEGFGAQLPTTPHCARPKRGNQAPKRARPPLAEAFEPSGDALPWGGSSAFSRQQSTETGDPISMGATRSCPLNRFARTDAFLELADPEPCLPGRVRSRIELGQSFRSELVHGHSRMMSFQSSVVGGRQVTWVFFLIFALMSAIIGALVGATLHAMSRKPVKKILDAGGKPVNHNHMPKLYDASRSNIGGFLIDLDGTMYTPDGLVPGAIEFFTYMNDNKIPYVFVSNTGSKSSIEVSEKLSVGKFSISKKQVSLAHIWTAAEAQMDMMTDDHGMIPEDAYLFVMSGFKDDDKHRGTLWLDGLRERNKTLVDTWTIRTALSMAEAQGWGFRGSKGEIKVFVVMFLDGPLAINDPLTRDYSQPEPKWAESPFYAGDWSYDLIAKANAILLTGKGSLVFTADDAFNPSTRRKDEKDEDSEITVYPQPGPGMMASLLMKGAHGETRMLCAGKGGDLGKKYMMEKAIKMLQNQGHSGDKSLIAMVGDRFDTDIRGGVNVGIKTILVESGTHEASMQKDYIEAPATWFAPSVLELIPSNGSVAPPRVKSFLNFASTAV